MIEKNLKKLKSKFKTYRIDGYIVPQNDEYFSEYSKKNRLQIISNFSGSAGYAVILRNKNYLFVDGRYTIQAQLESSKNFKIVDYNKIVNCDLFKKLVLGLDPKLFTTYQVKKFFLKYNKIKKIKDNLIDKIHKSKNFQTKPFYSLNKNITGQDFKIKINNVTKYLIKNKSNYLFISAPENVAWLLNIRGYDNPNSPIPNCYLFLDNKKNWFLITEKNKTINLVNEKKLRINQIIEPKNFENLINRFKSGKIIIDSKTCSLDYENILKKKFKILKKDDPIYLFKSIKNKKEIQNMIKSHIYDGVALTKFLYWIKKSYKKKNYRIRRH